VWDIVRALVAGGTTVLLTTQYLEEADQLAEGIAIVDHGRVIAEGTSGQLKATVGAGSLRVRVADAARRPEAIELLAQMLDAPVQAEGDPTSISALATDTELIGTAVAELGRRGITLVEIAVGQPSLDEVFLALTGHPAETDAGADLEIAVVEELR
jgi:ABC-2 type transport system ATP-binding protein